MSGLVADLRVLGPLYAYWRSKAAAGLPRRRDIDPAEIPALLPNLCIVYRDADGEFRYGLTGEAVVSHYGANFANRRFKDLLTGERFAAANRHHAMAWDSRRPVWCRNRYFAEGLPDCIVTRVILPLAGNDGGVAALLVGSEFECTFVYYKALEREWSLLRTSDEACFLDGADAPRNSVAGTRVFIDGDASRRASPAA